MYIQFATIGDDKGFLDSIAYGSSTNMFPVYRGLIRNKFLSCISLFRKPNNREPSNLEISRRSTVVNNVLISESSQFTLRDSDESEAPVYT